MKKETYTLTDEDGRTIAVVENIHNDVISFEKAIIQAVLEHTGNKRTILKDNPLDPRNFIGEDKEIEMVLYDEDEERTEHTIRIESVLVYGNSDNNNLSNKTSNNMKEFKGTKGEWTVIKDRVFKGNVTIQTKDVDICDIEKVGDETIYNAKLIATAPELLEALKYLVDYNRRLLTLQEVPKEQIDFILKQPNEAISKALDNQ